MLVILIVITALAYSFNLGQVPVHLNQDEMGFSLNAYSIAKTGFDENGRFLPMYFWHLGVMWSTPIIVYLLALILTVLPISEIIIRLPSILVGLSNIILVYFLSKRFFGSNRFALITAVFLALTPVHFIQSRILLDNLYPLPFVLGWFLLLMIFKEKKKLWFLFLSTLLLGLGVHSYHAAKVMMPFFLLLTVIVTFPEFRRNKQVILIMLVAFILPLLPLIPWLKMYPDTLTDQVRYTGLYDTRLSPLEGIVTLMTPEKISERVLIYLNYFDPTFLFARGDASLIHSTWKVGVFLLPLIFLLPLGIYQIAAKKSWMSMIILVGFFAAPVAPALVAHSLRISKALLMLPFAALIATAGLQFLLTRRRLIWQWIGIVLIVLIPIQFSYFFYDYLNDYRVHSYNWFNFNIPGALEEIIEQENNASKIYLDGKIGFIDRYWRFYLIKHHREDLIDKTVYFDPEISAQNFDPESVVLYRFDHLQFGSVEFNNRRAILEPDGRVSFYIFLL